MNFDKAPPGLRDLLTGWLRGPFTAPDDQADGSASNAGIPHDPRQVSVQGSVPTSMMESVIDSMVESLDSLVAVEPNLVPSAGQLRQARGRLGGGVVPTDSRSSKN
jgi:hypothetical protein